LWNVLSSAFLDERDVETGPLIVFTTKEDLEADHSHINLPKGITNETLYLMGPVSLQILESPGTLLDTAQNLS